MPDSLAPVNSANAPRYKYYTVDIMSNTIIGEIPFEDVSYSNAIKEAGIFDGKISINDQTTNLDLYAATLPGRTALFVVRDNVCTWGGIIWGRSYDMVGRSLTVTASEFTSYLNHRVIWKTYSYNITANLIKTKANDFVLVESQDKTFNTNIPLADPNGAKNQAYVVFKDRILTKFNSTYEIMGVDDGAPHDPTKNSFYIKIPNLPTPKTGSYSGVSVSTRTDTYDYLRQIITDTFADFTDIDFANEIIEPGIAKAIYVSEFKIDRIDDFNATATLYTSKPHKLVAGQFIETANIHELLTRSLEVIETPTPKSFVVKIKNPTSLDGYKEPLDIDSVSLTSPITVKEKVQYREIITSRTSYISSVQRLYNNSESLVTLTFTSKHHFKKDDIITVKIPDGKDISNTNWGAKVNTFDYKDWNNIVYVKSITPTTVTFADPSYSGSKYNVGKTLLKNPKSNTAQLSTPLTEFRLWPGANSHGYSVGDRVRVTNVDGMNWTTPIYDGYNTISAVSDGISYSPTHYSAVDETNLVSLFFSDDVDINAGDFITVVAPNHLDTLNGVHMVSVGSVYDATSSSYKISFTKVIRLDDDSETASDIARTSISGVTVSVKGTSWVTASRTYDQLSSISLTEPDAVSSILSFKYTPPVTANSKTVQLDPGIDRSAKITLETVDRHSISVGDKVNIKYNNAADNDKYGGNGLNVVSVGDYDQITYAIPPRKNLPTQEITKTPKKGNITRVKTKIGQIPIVEVQITSIAVDGNLVTVSSEDHDLNVGDYVRVDYSKDIYAQYENNGEPVKIVSAARDTFSYYTGADLVNSSEFIVKGVTYAKANINGRSRDVIEFKVITDNAVEPTDGTPGGVTGELRITVSVIGFTSSSLSGTVLFENTSGSSATISLTASGGTLNPTSITAAANTTNSVPFTLSGLSASTKYTITASSGGSSVTGDGVTKASDGSGGTGSPTAMYPLQSVKLQDETDFISATFYTEASNAMTVAAGDTVTISGLEARGESVPKNTARRGFNVIKVVHTVSNATSKTGKTKLYFAGDPEIVKTKNSSGVLTYGNVKLGGTDTIVSGTTGQPFTETPFSNNAFGTTPGNSSLVACKLFGLMQTSPSGSNSTISKQILSFGPSLVGSGLTPTGNFFVEVASNGYFSKSFTTQVNNDGYGSVTFPAQTTGNHTVITNWAVLNTSQAQVLSVASNGTSVTVRIAKPAGYSTSGLKNGTFDVSILNAIITVSRKNQINPGPVGATGATSNLPGTGTAGSGVALIGGATTVPPMFSTGDTVFISGFTKFPNTLMNFKKGVKIVAVGGTGLLDEPNGDNRQYRIFKVINPAPGTGAKQLHTNIGLSAFKDDHVKGSVFLRAAGSAVIDYSPTSPDVKEITDMVRNSYTSATVYSSSHGLTVGDWVNLWVYGKRNSSFNNNNTPVQISSVSTDGNSFNYTMSGLPAFAISHIVVDASTATKVATLVLNGGQTHNCFPGDVVTLSDFPSNYIAAGITGDVSVLSVTPRTITVKLAANATISSRKKVKLASIGYATIKTVDNQSSVLDPYDGMIIPAPMIVREPVAFSKTYGEYPKNAGIGGMEFSTLNYSQLNTKNEVLRGSDLTNVASHLEQYSNSVYGFDYRIDCELVVDPTTGNKRFKKIFKLIPTYPATLTTYLNSLPLQDDPYDPNSDKQIHALAPGQVAPPAAFGADKLIFEYPGNISNINLTENAESSATRVFVTSNNPDTGRGEAAYSGAGAEDLLAAGWPLLDKAEKVDWGVASTDKVNVDNWGNYDAELDLYKTAKRFLYESKPPAGDFIITINGSLNPVIGTYQPGDWCSVVVNDQFIKTRLQNALEPRKDVIIRKIDSIKVTVPNNPAFPEQIDLTVIPDWQVDRVGE